MASCISQRISSSYTANLCCDLCDLIKIRGVAVQKHEITCLGKNLCTLLNDIHVMYVSLLLMQQLRGEEDQYSSPSTYMQGCTRLYSRCELCSEREPKRLYLANVPLLQPISSTHCEELCWWGVPSSLIEVGVRNCCSPRRQSCGLLIRREATPCICCCC